MVSDAVEGRLKNVKYHRDPIFKVEVPESCPSVKHSEILSPESMWGDKAAYIAAALKLAGEFTAHFIKAFGNKGIAQAIVDECPGR
jgi:phosphoenolpyruvate carboxykinase (ATP)